MEYLADIANTKETEMSLIRNLVVIVLMLIFATRVGASQAPVKPVQKQQYRAALEDGNRFYQECIELNIAHAAQQGIDVGSPQVQGMIINACGCFTHFAAKEYDLKTPLTEEQFRGVVEKCRQASK